MKKIKIIMSTIFILMILVGCATTNLVPPTAPQRQVAVQEITGISAPAGSLASQFAWLTRNVDSHNTYILTATENETISPVELNFSPATNVTIVLQGDTERRSIRVNSQTEPMITVRSNVTLVLNNNIHLLGHRRERGSMVRAEYGGHLVMNDGAIISGNNLSDPDWVSNRSSGAGVSLGARATFVMNGGSIEQNSTTSRGGGVAIVFMHSTFTMNGGQIIFNSAGIGGGLADVHGQSTEFLMRGGIIAGNGASIAGGGVFINCGLGSRATVRKTGGTIWGNVPGDENSNTVRDEEGILNRRGHAIFVGMVGSGFENQPTARLETTSGPNANISISPGQLDTRNRSSLIRGNWTN